MKERLRRTPIIWWAGLLAIALLLVLAPFLFHPGASFTGSDDRAVELIASTHAGTRPWFQPLWQPGSPGLENLLFGLQAAVGLAAIVLFFVVKRRKRGEKSPKG
jgi:cobalt/nickel transport protein